MRPRVKRLEAADEVRAFEKGRFELLELGGTTVGRASYEPGWRWPEPVGRASGEASARWSTSAWSSPGVPRSRWTMAAWPEVGPGDLFHCPPGHDSWVVGDEPYVSLHFLGAEGYAEKG